MIKHSIPRDTASSLSLADLNSSSMVATEAAGALASAAVAAATCTSSSGFDLINHAIRMGSATPPIPPSTVNDGFPKGIDHRSSSELLLKAHFLDQQQRGASLGAPISRVSSASSTLGALSSLVSGHSHASEIVAAVAVAQNHASLVRQQLGNGGLVAALQRRHDQQSLSELPLSAASLQLQQHLRVASLLGGAAPVSAPGTSSIPSKAPTTSTADAHRQSQDEHNARQLNPNAFQFPWKLHDMLDRSSTEGNQHIVSWVDNGDAFRVHVPDAFVENIMSRFFKQTKYKSFQRQLNLYGFTRLHNGPNKGGYKHKYFRRGQRTLCQLITRCPIRDSSSAATAIAAAAAGVDAIADRLSMGTSMNGTQMIADEDNTVSTQPHAPSSISINSREDKQKHHQQSSSDALLLNQHHQTNALLAARQQALTSSFQIMEKARQEHQLQQLQVQQYEAHRLKQLELLQQQPEISFTKQYLPGMPLAGTDHSTYPNVARRQHSVSRISNPTPDLELAKGKVDEGPPHHILDASNNSSLLSEVQDAFPVTPTSSKLSEKEKMSMFRKEFNFKEFQFPWKLYEMLSRADAEEFSHLVSWMPDDSCFKVHDAGNFVKSVMPRFFKQTKYKSFQRQLNLYGFIRVDTGPNKAGYRHPNFVKGRKDLLATINRMKIKGNGRSRTGSNSTSIIIDTDSSDYPNMSTGSGSKAASVEATNSVNSNSGSISGIAVILEAIKAKESKDAIATKAPTTTNAVANDGGSNVVQDAPDGNCDASNSTIPSTIDIGTKESSETKNGNVLSWRQNPSESFSDWTIKVVEKDAMETEKDDHCAIYHVHRRVLAVGPKKSDYFANIFKVNNSDNTTKLQLTKQQAALFPVALDYIYADTDFDIDTEKAYALYSLGERLINASIIKAVVDYYCKWCMTKENIVDFLKLGRSFTNKALLEAAVLKCSQVILFMDIESASKIDPGLLLRILVIATTVAQNQEVPEYDSLKLSQLIAMSVFNRTTITSLTIDIFRSLTDKLVLPSLEPVAAIKLLSTENSLLRGEMVGDHFLHERCVSSIYENWSVLFECLSQSNELADAMKSISSKVLFDILMKTKNSGVSGAVSTDMATL